MKDQLIMREVLTIKRILYKAGSKEAGQKRTEVADKLNCYSLFKEMPWDQCSVRERFDKLIEEYKKA